MEKIEIFFRGGESRHGSYGCNYMIGKYEDEYGFKHELYAEELLPIEWNKYKYIEEIPLEDLNRFDDESYAALKEEIIEQAKEAGIDESDLSFE